MADTTDSKSVIRKYVGVQVPPPALFRDSDSGQDRESVVEEFSQDLTISLCKLRRKLSTRLGLRARRQDNAADI